jgi:Cu-Zn family superoxide dismutase
VPRRAYGAHLHTRPCTATPADAGPHYQHSPDPKAAASPPSVDPAYANPRNEIWLDFTADAAGAATVTARQDWTFDEVEPPRSMIVHAERTRTAAGQAGMAGPRVACLTLGPR